MRLDDALAWGAGMLKEHEGSVDAAVLMMHVLQQQRSYLYTWPDSQLTADQEVRYKQLVAQRKSGIPVAHLTGNREFWSLPLQVDSSTLIPRPDTECLVEWALELLPRKASQVLDLGTGTGAIALALASECNAWKVMALEQQAQAVALARANTRSLNLQAQVEVLQSNWFSSLTGSGTFDLIVSNPPYIAEDDKHLDEGDVRFEPNSALVSGADGLDDIRHIIQQAPNYLAHGAWLLLEHGFEQGPAVQELLTSNGYKEMQTRSDLAGNPRVTGGVWQP
ncbi:peptide chain release factor N(5)-glutamine methyltransferase [Echinimonas agarilytica]|uniref:Release factor glutamine methyltransferase n=1 Tax=Echinimonas agarilytica TaxID=1215918 RepID=A0AA41W598_9GAMM|nr:peptide chain release factor N(5)-glutamine methyltransferase [Echinimonas agarilytica]MCM2679189.1 peptide chain release factor N(5)-glutamine methyltransferase [Echinimonas agarilytica]